MLIKKIILYKYKRFFLNNIEKLEYTPNEKLQIIIGSNGSGKSSLLKELNPLPADIKRDYREDGYKLIEIEHNMYNYVLSSNYVSNGKHSFIQNEVELNTGGTKKVQLELIKDHFNLTPNIVEILLNNDRLTNMSPSSRKYWFTELSTVDYSYSLSVYNKLKQRHRDIIGGIKLLQEDIINTEANSIDKNELTILESNRKYLEDYITHIVSLYDHNIRTSDNLTIMEDITKLSKNIRHILTHRFNYKNKETIVKLITNYENRLQYINNDIIRISKEIDQIDKVKNIKDVGSIKKELNTLTKEIENLTKDIYLNVDYNHLEDMYNSYSFIHSDLVSIISNLSEYDEYRRLSKEEELSIIDSRNLLEIEYNKLSKKLELLCTDIEHIEQHKKSDNLVSCPKCDHSWYNKYNEFEHNKLLKERNTLLVRKDYLVKELTTLNKKIDSINNKNAIKNNIKELMLSKLELKQVWVYLVNKIDIDTSSVNEIITLLDRINIDLFKWSKVKDLIDKKSKTETELSSSIDINIITNSYNQNSLTKLHKQLDELVKDKNTINKELVILNDEYILLKNLEKDYNSLLNKLTLVNKSLEANVISVRNKYLTDLVNLLKIELVKIEQRINNSNITLNKLNKDKKLLEDYKIKEKVLNITLKELSPTEGLIAKSMNSFLNVFVREMNHVINSIWSYTMEILPCEVSEEDDLDYKFRVKVNDSEIIEDVSKLSSSMQEIVDLAFRLVFAKYMDIKEAPLYLDEFGRTFDKQHRTSAYNVIDKIISSDYKQIFIVSHYESLYGALRNVDINVLNDSNIELDTTTSYNEVLKIN